MGALRFERAILSSRLFSARSALTSVRRLVRQVVRLDRVRQVRVEALDLSQHALRLRPAWSRSSPAAGLRKRSRPEPRLKRGSVAPPAASCAREPCSRLRSLRPAHREGSPVRHKVGTLAGFRTPAMIVRKAEKRRFEGRFGHRTGRGSGTVLRSRTVRAPGPGFRALIFVCVVAALASFPPGGRSRACEPSARPGRRVAAGERVARGPGCLGPGRPRLARLAARIHACAARQAPRAQGERWHAGTPRHGCSCALPATGCESRSAGSPSASGRCTSRASPSRSP